jgi:ATP-dependent exoDNAse (exonuclease V) beta subunit
VDGDAAREAAKSFGLAVHAVLELADFEDLNTLAPLATAQASERRSPERAAEIAAAARRALASETLLRARVRRFYREMPVAFVEDDLIVEGQIDLVYVEDDGSLVIVDYKTDAVADEPAARERAEAYRAQVALYAIALERATGLTVREAILLFLVPGVEVRLRFDEVLRRAGADAINAARSRDREDTGSAAVSPGA